MQKGMMPNRRLWVAIALHFGMLTAYVRSGSPKPSPNGLVQPDYSEAPNEQSTGA